MSNPFEMPDICPPIDINLDLLPICPDDFPDIADYSIDEFPEPPINHPIPDFTRVPFDNQNLDMEVEMRDDIAKPRVRKKRVPILDGEGNDTGEEETIFVVEIPSFVLPADLWIGLYGLEGHGGVIASGAPCKITGGNSLMGYNVDLYANGRFKPATGTGILHLLEVAAMSNLPVGSWVVGWNVQQALTGGND